MRLKRPKVAFGGHLSLPYYLHPKPPSKTPLFSFTLVLLSFFNVCFCVCKRSRVSLVLCLSSVGFLGPWLQGPVMTTVNIYVTWWWTVWKSSWDSLTPYIQKHTYTLIPHWEKHSHPPLSHWICLIRNANVQFSHASMSNIRTHMGHITEREHVTKKPTEMGNNFIHVNLTVKFKWCSLVITLFFSYPYILFSLLFLTDIFGSMKYSCRHTFIFTFSVRTLVSHVTLL